ncbi:MAG: hypothetical protein IJT76_01075 [Clostridia bacterium]|nr:hypothetical protein [Clostridia bacterium]
MSIFWHTERPAGFADGKFLYYREGTCHEDDVKPTGADAADLAEASMLVESSGLVSFYNREDDKWDPMFSVKEAAL